MFRGTKNTRWGADEAAALYRGVLRREPSAQEITELSKAISDAGTPEGALKDMLSSHEFGVMVLPNLVHEYVRSVPTMPVFFLHIPKTAGTSFRLALTETMGLPSFLLYAQSSWAGFGTTATMDFWPLWAGHAGISNFPTSHRGVTVFRESRSRALSAYRQQERQIEQGVYNVTRFSRDDGFSGNDKGSVTAAGPFSEWVKYSQGVTQWFFETPLDTTNRLWDGRPRSAWVRALEPNDARAMLSRTLNRFDAAAWAHDSDAMAKSIETIVGKSVTTTIGRENSFAEESRTKPTVLTADDLAQLDRIAHEERILWECAVDRGLIPPLDSDRADFEFERTASRLGFTFA